MQHKLTLVFILSLWGQLSLGTEIRHRWVNIQEKKVGSCVKKQFWFVPRVSHLPVVCCPAWLSAPGPPLPQLSAGHPAAPSACLSRSSSVPSPVVQPKEGVSIFITLLYRTATTNIDVPSGCIPYPFFNAIYSFHLLLLELQLFLLCF